MASWVDRLDDSELKAIIPAEAIQKVSDDDIDGAAAVIERDLKRKGLKVPMVDAGRGEAAKGYTVKRSTKKKADGPAVPKRSTKASHKKEKLSARVQEEMRLLLCTNDGKYAELRKKLRPHQTAATTTIVSAIAVGVGGVLGIAAGLCVPFVAMLLLAALTVGKNVWCAGFAGPQ